MCKLGWKSWNVSMQKSFKQRLEALEQLEAHAGGDRAALEARIFDGFSDVRAWLAGALETIDPARVYAMIRLPLVGPYNSWARDLSYAMALYAVALACVERYGVDDCIPAIWEHNAALCCAVAEHGEPVCFRGETGSLIGLSYGRLWEPVEPIRATYVAMDDGTTRPWPAVEHAG